MLISIFFIFVHIHQLPLNMNFQHVRGEREIKEGLTFTSEGRLVGHGLGADITGSGITDTDRHKVVSMTTFVFLFLVLKKQGRVIIYNSHWDDHIIQHLNEWKSGYIV